MTWLVLAEHGVSRFSFRDFYASRARRIIPALLAMCMFMLTAGWFFLSPLEYKQLGGDAAASAGFLSNIRYFQQAGYFEPAASERWLLHTWSLSVEWQFYLIYPLAIGAIRLVFGADRRILILSIWCSLLASFGLSMAVGNLRPSADFYLLPTRAWEMLAGALVYLHSPIFERWRSSRFLVHTLDLCGLSIIVGAAAAFDSNSVWPGYRAAVPVMGAILVLAASNAKSPITGNRLAQAIGTWSYSIYLWHWPLVTLLRDDSGLFRRSCRSLGIGGSVAAGWLSYRFFEQPMRRGSAKLSNHAQLAAAAIMCSCAAFAAVLVDTRDGMPERYTGPRANEIRSLRASLGRFRLSAVLRWVGRLRQVTTVPNRRTRRSLDYFHRRQPRRTVLAVVHSVAFDLFRIHDLRNLRRLPASAEHRPG